MLPARETHGSNGRKVRICSVRTSWHTVGDGEFFCPGCGGDRNYRRRTGRRRLAVLGVPVLPRGLAGPVVECAACHDRFGTEVLDHPTTARLSAMLRDAVHTVALAVLAAGGTSSHTVVRTAVRAVRDAGYDDCTADGLTGLVEALTADTGRYLADAGGPYGAALAVELHEALEPLAPHLAAAGRESVLLQGARIALADGAYTQAERDVLATVGNALLLRPGDTARLMEAARAPF
ncbi:TerB family tellurite resistance protein [Streptomyces somaliensis DSM 40738]|uniref:TerB family tellurite resistance protein n=1 Tax=Streptomyces somaliensis (strain ATCC 33201 / DSM 40738 / JCM 12659 / KCTC 9044 / NCTC 11332 / NRRL B-12077 / IP 733) TaxID=1134445 RepID=A0AA44DA81_STRE0|nr:TerB family tellurite resistance protein [Streptomyces somaliensis]MCQ0022652.1 TerB family tellurite resistance protein [Streptomyces somaliensis DSM 40738]NKY12753.1 TerB family tellurite resistance protein [Streptomyces somaliensis DSM 40738]